MLGFYLIPTLGFMDVLNHINLNAVWRQVVGQPEPDLHAKDTEILLRVLAMTATGTPSLWAGS